MANNANSHIRVMHILPNLQVGGMENALIQLVNRLDADKYITSICCIENKDNVEILSGKLINKSVSFFNLNKKDGIDYGLPIKLAKLINTNKIDIIHARNWSSIFYGTIGARLSLGRRAVLADIRGMHSPAQYRAMGLMSPAITRYVAVTRNIATSMVDEWKIKEQKVSIIHNGVDLSRFESASATSDTARKSLGIKQNTVVIGTVGRLAQVKNYETLLRAFGIVSQKTKDAKLVFIGDGPERETLKRLASDLKINDKVIFHGFEMEVEKYYKVMDVFILPSIREGSSNTILEAMASRVPVIASDVGGNGEVVIDGVTGMLFSAGDSKRLADLISECIGNKEKCGNMAEKAFLRLTEEYDIGKTVEQYDKIYQELYN